MNISTLIFDCDGTLLDTFEDLKNAVNYALTTSSYPSMMTITSDSASVTGSPT